MNLLLPLLAIGEPVTRRLSDDGQKKVQIIGWSNKRQFTCGEGVGDMGCAYGGGAHLDFDALNPEALDLMNVWPEFNPNAMDKLIPARPCTKLLIHGWGAAMVGQHESWWNMGYIFTTQYFGRTWDTFKECNVIGIDWSALAPPDQYEQSANNVLPVGDYVAEFLNEILFKQMAMTPDQIHCIGHSLGGQMCGRIGRVVEKLTGEKLGRISALDPAGPLWVDGGMRRRSENPSQLEQLLKEIDDVSSSDRGLESECISRNDGKFVDVYHTNGATESPMASEGYFGALRPLGHVDFFYNGGSWQPGCDDHPNFVPRSDLKGCSHWMGLWVYVQSIGSPGSFGGKPCYSFDECQDLWKEHGKIKEGSDFARPNVNYGGEYARIPETKDMVDAYTGVTWHAYKAYNYYYWDTNNLGEYGGTCECPDGSTYLVADNNNWCGSLACNGGKAGECKHYERQGTSANGWVGWSSRGVDCVPAQGGMGDNDQWNINRGIRAWDSDTFAFYIETKESCAHDGKSLWDTVIKDPRDSCMLSMS